MAKHLKMTVEQLIETLNDAHPKSAVQLWIKDGENEDPITAPLEIVLIGSEGTVILWGIRNEEEE